MEIIIGILLIIGGFCLGSVMFSRIIPMLLVKKDIQLSGRDENPGAANVFVHCGWRLGLLCLALDMLKGFAPVFAALLLLGEDSLFIPFIMLSPVLGHAVAPFNHLKGGKCISTAFGEMVALLLVTHVGLILAAIYIFFATAVRNKSNRLRSIWAFSVFVLISTPFLICFKHYTVMVGCVLVSVTAIVKHSKMFVNKAQAEFEKTLTAMESEKDESELVEIK